VHLTTPAVSCEGLGRVDLDGLWWYQKQAGLVGGFFLIFECELNSCVEQPGRAGTRSSPLV
jgi:hypothetical protein